MKGNCAPEQSIEMALIVREAVVASCHFHAQHLVGYERMPNAHFSPVKET